MIRPIEMTVRILCSSVATQLMCSMLSALRALSSARSASHPLVAKFQPRSSRSNLRNRMVKVRKEKVMSQVRRMITCSTECSMMNRLNKDLLLLNSKTEH